MAQFVAGDMEGESADRRLVAVYDAPAHPLVGREPAKECNRRRSHGAILLDQLREGLIFEARGGDVLLLVEPLERAPVAAEHAQQAIREDALVIGEMTEDFLQRPFAGRVAKAPDSMLVKRSQVRREMSALLLQCTGDIITRHARDVGLGVARVLAGQGAA